MRSEYYDEDDENFIDDFSMEDDSDDLYDFDDDEFTFKENKVNYEPLLDNMEEYEDFKYEDEAISRKLKRRIILDSIKLNSQFLFWNILPINTKLRLIETTFTKLISLIKH